MYNIKYVTQNNEDHTDKQKIYFSCHPNDMKLYFDILKNDIFGCADCAILYDENPFAEYDKSDYENLLASVSLIVIPVTSKYLSEHSRSRDFDVKFALESFIPVMPVMMEKGLEPSFNRIVGDLQLLDRTSDDRTAVAYTEKLKNYLESVLADTQLLQDISSSFSANIFLSYRKKDRAHANRLMQLIHSFDDFRDVAIWYDEFLTTGEDYNKSIENALVQSDVFALAVTPNLLEKDNYVMTTEFPDAIKHKKDILAVELAELEADKKADFSAYFSGCPAPISAESPQLVADKLQQILQKLEISPTEDTPQHRYLIGLAYLGGINVEKNADKALNLIKSAANDGLLDAMKKLANMYLNGDGVAIDVKKSALWQQKLVDFLEEEHDENPSSEKAKLTVNAMEQLCLLHIKCMDFKEVLNVTEDIEFFCDQYYNPDNFDFYWVDQLIFALSQRAMAFYQTRQLEAAEREFNNELLLLNALCKRVHHPLIMRYIGEVHHNLYAVYMALEDTAKAEESMARYRSIASKASSANNSVNQRLEMIQMYLTNTNLCLNKNDSAQALKNVQMAILLGEQLLQESDEKVGHKLKFMLSSAYNHKAILIKEKDMPSAQQLFKKSADILEQLRQTSDSVHCDIELSNVYRNMAVSECPDAEYFMERAIFLMENLNSKHSQETLMLQLYMIYNDSLVFFALHNSRDKFDRYALKTMELLAKFPPHLRKRSASEIKVMHINMAKALKIFKESK